jgi:glycosyltransferase involved in cell wall biosynthesis
MAKILLLGSYSESLINFRGKLLEEFVRRGHDVLACAPDISDRVQQQLSVIGVQCKEVKLNRTGTNPLHDLSTLIDFYKTIREFGPEYFLAYTVKPVIYGSFAAKLAKVPNIYSIITGLGNVVVGGTGRYRLINYIVKKLYVLSLKNNRRVFFQNPDDLDLFESEGYLHNKKQAVLINGSGIDIDDFHPEAFPDAMSFLLIARLIADKGIREYVEASRELKKKYPDILFRLVGMFDSNPQALKEEEINGWVSDGIIDFLGELQDVKPAIADTSVYVLPSYYREGTPRTVLEAMAMGRPIITTDAPGCRETVEDGKNGFLIPVKDKSALIRAMEYFITTPDMLSICGKESRKIAVEKYDVHKVNKMIVEAMGL